VLAAPLLAAPTVWVLLEEPDHIGTSMFLLLSFLLIDRFPDRRSTAPLVCLILCAGQLGDLTVRLPASPRWRKWFGGGRIYGLRTCFTVLPCPDCCRFLRAGGRVRGREAPAWPMPRR